jgi:hypothetical protein
VTKSWSAVSKTNSTTQAAVASDNRRRAHPVGVESGAESPAAWHSPPVGVRAGLTRSPRGHGGPLSFDAVNGKHSPDPIKRQAAIQVIVESGDANKIDFALKIALASDDAAVRGTALRAYMAHLKTLNFEIQAPPEIQRQIEAAINSDPDRLKDLGERYKWVKDLSNAGYHMQFALRGYSMSNGTGTGLVTSGGSQETSFTVAGDRVSGEARMFYSSGLCAYTFQPQVLVKGSAPILKGTLRCSQANTSYLFPTLTITAPLF